MVAAAPPPEAALAAMDAAGFEVVHVYGLTEVYGPAVVNEWHEEWNALDAAGRAAKKARQGVRYHALEELAVLDPETMEPVPPGALGEVMFRGNVVMKGYLKNEAATRQAFAGGWFHSGDLGVMDEEGYVQLKDRSKDIIISGGENISSIEVENVLTKHPAVLFAAVVAKPDEKWGESPCAFIEKKRGHDAVTRGRHHRLRAGKHGQIQGAAACRVPGTAQDLDRQDPEIPAAGNGEELELRPRTPSGPSSRRAGSAASASVNAFKAFQFVFYSKFLFFEGRDPGFIPIGVVSSAAMISSSFLC